MYEVLFLPRGNCDEKFSGCPCTQPWLPTILSSSSHTNLIHQSLLHHPNSNSNYDNTPAAPTLFLLPVATSCSLFKGWCGASIAHLPSPSLSSQVTPQVISAHYAIPVPQQHHLVACLNRKNEGSYYQSCLVKFAL